MSYFSSQQLKPRVGQMSVVLMAVMSVTPGTGFDICAAPPVIERGVPYGEANNERLLADVYLPADSLGDEDQARPAVLLVHSEGWCSGSREAPMMATMGKALAESGYAAFSIDYRLVKDADDGKEVFNQYPAAIEDCWRALRWIRTRADKYRVDPQRIGAFGDSAGGHLVSLLGTAAPRGDHTSSADTADRVRAVVTVYGPADLTKDFSHCRYPDGSTVQDLINRFLGGDRGGPTAKEASPIFHINDRSAAFLIVHGSDDKYVPVEQSRDFHLALKKAGRKSQFVEIEEAGHGFLPKDQQQLVSDTVRFFDRNLKRLGSTQTGG